MLIGVNGQLGSGKDAFCERAQHLAASGAIETPGPVERRAFADKLKQSVAALFGITLDFMEKAKRDETTLVQIRELRFGISRVTGLRWTRHIPGFERIVVSQTMRVTLQRKGTEAGRDIFGDDFWIDQCVPEDLDHEGKVVIVTDARFPNEAERIKAAGGFMVRVSAGDLNGDPHPSEQVLDSSLISLEVDNSIRDDNFAALDEAVKVAFWKPTKIKRTPLPEEKPVIRRATRSIDSIVRMEDTTDGE